MPNGKLRHFYYLGGTTQGGKDGILISVTPPHAEKWIGTFSGEGGYSDPFTRVLSWPDPNKICVVTSGTGFIVDTLEPEKFDIVSSHPIVQTLSNTEKKLVIFANFTDLLAYDGNGIAWRTDRISWDGLKMTGINGSYLEGEYREIRSDSDAKFKVSLRDGRLAIQADEFQNGRKCLCLGKCGERGERG